MALDDERRQLTRWSDEIGIGRRVVQRVAGGLAVFGRKGDGPRRRDVVRVDVLVQAAPKRLSRARGCIQADDGGGLGRRGGDEYQCVAVRAHAARVRGVRQIGALELRGLAGLDERQAVDAILADDARDAAIGQERVCAHAENPLRRTELGSHRRQRLDVVVVLAIQVPPAGSIRNEVQLALWTPLGLEDRLALATGQPSCIRDRAVRGQVADPQLRAVPGHARVVPDQPGQLAAIGADARRRIEVVAFGDDARFARAVGWHGNQLVGRFGTFGLVPFADAQQQLAVGRQAGVGVACSRGDARLGRDRPRFLARVLAVHTLVGEVREEHRLAIDHVRATAVLVRAGSHGQRPGCQLLARAVRGLANQHDAAAFQGLAFEPVHVVTDNLRKCE